MEREQHPSSSEQAAETLFRVQWATSKSNDDRGDDDPTSESNFLELSIRRRQHDSLSKADQFWDSCDRYLLEAASSSPPPPQAPQAATATNDKDGLTQKQQQDNDDHDIVKEEEGSVINNPPPPPPPPTQQLPRRLPLPRPPSDIFQPSDFRLLKTLGQGGYGCVYKAIHLSTRYVVALKELTGSASDVEVFDHRTMPWDCGVVPCYGTFRGFSSTTTAAGSGDDHDDDNNNKKNEDDNNVCTAVTTKETLALAKDTTRLKTWLILKYCPGGSLVDRLLQQQQPSKNKDPSINNQSQSTRRRKVGVLSEREAARMTKRIVKTLLFLKEQYGIVHNDIKPANLLEDGKGGYYLCDFGAAQKGLWQKDRIGGTYSYMPPEKLRARKLAGLLTHYCNHEKHDVWSLGVTLFVAIFARHPFNAKAIAKCTTITSSGHDAAKFYDLMETNYNNIQYPKPKGTTMTISKGLRNLLERMLTPCSLERLTLSCVKEHSWVQRNVSSSKASLIWLSHAKQFARENLLLSSAICSAMSCKSFPMTTDANNTHVTQDQAFLKVLCQEPTVTMDGSEEDPPLPPAPCLS